MQTALTGSAPMRLPNRPRTLLVKEDAIWLWPGISLTQRQGRTIIPVDIGTARAWLTKWHGPEVNRQPITTMLARAAVYLNGGDTGAAQALLDRAGFTHISPEGAALMKAVAARLGIAAPGMPVLTRNSLWQVQDVARFAPLFDSFSGTAAWLEKSSGTPWDPAKHPRLGTAPNPGWFADTSGDDGPAADPAPPKVVPPDRLSEFENDYDGLGPVEFAQAVTQFGDSLGRTRGQLSPEEREEALARYSFLQDRLSFWLSYDYKPPRSQDNLISAALVLYEGAVNSGVVPVGGPHGGIPRSMLAVAGAAIAYGDGPPSGGLRRPSESPPERYPDPRDVTPETVGELGSVIDNKHIGIVWNSSIIDQGRPFEVFVWKQKGNIKELSPGSKTFDHHNETTGEAISVKTLNTLSVTYIKNPKRIFNQLKSYTDAAANYKPRRGSDLDTEKIKSKTIQLAIPEYTSPTQWIQIVKAKRYAENQGISFIVTRIR